MTVSQELDLRSRRCVLQDERNMFGFNIRNAHVAGKWFSGDDDGYSLLEPQDFEERLRAVDILHDDREMVEMLQHGLPSPLNRQRYSDSSEQPIWFTRRRYRPSYF